MDEHKLIQTHPTSNTELRHVIHTHMSTGFMCPPPPSPLSLGNTDIHQGAYQNAIYPLFQNRSTQPYPRSTVPNSNEGLTIHTQCPGNQHVGTRGHHLRVGSHNHYGNVGFYSTLWRFWKVLTILLRSGLAPYVHYCAMYRTAVEYGAQECRSAG